jgi:hypothetical protein
MNGMPACHRIGIFLVISAWLYLDISAAISSPQVKVEEYRYQRRLTEDEQQWIDERFKKMRLEEKVGQMFMVTVPTAFLNMESDGFKELRQRVLEQRVGGIILLPGEVYEAAMLTDRLQELSRYPLLVAAEAETGIGMVLRGATSFPWNMAVGAAGDPTLAQRQGEAVAQEARVLGVNMLLAPVADMAQYATADPVNVRSYGDEPTQIAPYVSAFVRGAQTYGVMAVAKYFPGYGRATAPSSGGFATLAATRAHLDAAEFAPFRSAINEGVGGIIVGHIAVPQLIAGVVVLHHDVGRVAPRHEIRRTHSDRYATAWRSRRFIQRPDRGDSSHQGRRGFDHDATQHG